MIRDRLSRGSPVLPLAAVAGLVLVGSLILTAVADRHERVQARSDGFWQTALVQGSEVEWFGTMKEMLASSDAIVVARPVSFKPGRVFGDDTLKSYVYYGVLTLKVEQVLKGTPGGTVDLEMATAEPQVLDRLRATMPSDRAIYFLRNKATEARLYGPPPGSSVDAEARYWRLINSQGIYRDAGGKVAAPVNAEAGYAIRAEGMPFETLVQSITTGDGLPG